MAKKLFLLLLVMLPMMAMGQKKYEYVEKQFQKAMKNGKQPNGYYLAEKISRPQYQSSYTQDVASGKSITVKDLKQWAATHGYVLGKYTKVDRYGFIFNDEDHCVNTVYFLPENNPKDISSNTNNVGEGKKEGSTFNNATRIYSKGFWENGKFTGWQINVDTYKRIRVENGINQGNWEYIDKYGEDRDVYNEYLDATLSDEEKAKELAVGKWIRTSKGGFTVLSETEVTYSNSNNKKLIDLEIPSTLTIFGRTFVVTELKSLEGCSNLKSVVVPNTVTKIGEKAFKECKSLTSVTLPASLKSIGKEAFKDCSALTPIALPASCTDIGAELFAGCKISYDEDCRTIDLCYKKLKASQELSVNDVVVLDRFVKTYSATPSQDVKKKLPLAKELFNVHKVQCATNIRFQKYIGYRRTGFLGTSVEIEWWPEHVDEDSKKLADALAIAKSAKSQYGFTQVFSSAVSKILELQKQQQQHIASEKDRLEFELEEQKAEEAERRARAEEREVERTIGLAIAEDIDKGRESWPAYEVIDEGSDYHKIRFKDDKKTTGKLFYSSSKRDWYVDYGLYSYHYKTYTQAVKALYLYKRYGYTAKDGQK